MRLLANENVSRVMVEALWARGHDVFWARVDAPGESDRSHLQRAQRESRILLTFDTDFGELAFQQRIAASHGVILIRMTGAPETVAGRVVDALESQENWEGHFSVVEHDRVRMRPLPERQ